MSIDDHLGFIHRYAHVLRPEVICAHVVAMDAAPRKDEEDEAMGLVRAGLAMARDEEDEDMELLRAVLAKDKTTAQNPRPESDLEFYTRCAKASTQLT